MAHYNITKNPSFYKEYPDLFSTYFKSTSKEQIKQLSKAGYYYYHSLLSFDAIIDDGEIEELPKMLTLQEESIKLLTFVYGLNLPFWTIWNSRKEEYFEAIKIEKSLSKKEEIDFETYEDLADKKSAFGKIAIDSLFVLATNPNKEVYTKLLLSHKYFSLVDP